MSGRGKKGMMDGLFVPRAHLESLGAVEAGSWIHRSVQYTMPCHESYSTEYMPRRIRGPRRKRKLQQSEAMG